MARLAAKEKALFYPTPLPIVETIATNIIPAVSGPDERAGAILDPCCGSGEPLAWLGNQLGLTTYGNELHPERYAQARPRLDYCLNGAREFLEVEGRFNLVFNNPPYDQSLGGERMELAHIRADLDLLAPGGLGIWIIPETIIRYELCALLTGNLQQVTMRRFPPPAYDRFKQVVIFGLKRGQVRTDTYIQATGLERLVQRGLPVLQAAEFGYTYTPGDGFINRFALDFPDTGTVLADLEQHGVQAGPAWPALVGVSGAGFDHFQPVLRLTSGHTAMVIAAGIVNGTKVNIDAQPHLIKGSTSKRISVIEESELTNSGTQQITREREQLVQTITALNLVNGTLAEYNSLDDKQGFADFLLEHQDTLVESIDRGYPPLFEPRRDMPAYLPVLSRVRAPGKLAGRLVPEGLLPAQQVRAAALAARLKTGKAVILVGEMGVGKTATVQALAALIGQGHWKLVVVCPAQITGKWKREAETVLRDFGVKAHVIGHKRRQPDGTGRWRKVRKPVLDVMRAMAEPNPSLLIMSYETAKFGPRWEHAPAVQRKLLTYTVDVEESFPTYPYTHMVEQVVTRSEKVLCCPDCGQVIRNERGEPMKTIKQLGKRKRRCSHCDAALWQQIPFAYGGRVAIADFLNRHYSGRYHLVLDEAHNTKGADTDVGYASADLVAGAKKVIAMTGTLYAGKGVSWKLVIVMFERLTKGGDELTSQ